MTKKYLKYSDEFKPGDRSVYYRYDRYGDHGPTAHNVATIEVLFWCSYKKCWRSYGEVKNHGEDIYDKTFWCLRPLPPDIERVDSATKRQIEKALEKEKPKARKRRKRKQWEYLVRYEEYFERHLTKLGAGGWELVSTYKASNEELTFVFKRPKRKVKKSGSRTK